MSYNSPRCSIAGLCYPKAESEGSCGHCAAWNRWLEPWFATLVSAVNATRDGGIARVSNAQCNLTTLARIQELIRLRVYAV